ncbi:hypothetical protein C8F04DRAFT_964879 [Mycena alexandri]|uniref:CxC2-like cysteine cluster KDZ transposase-associated domain-containing protein n=1 Tax=Mycena alexandri TaxID=1745969 RepID=A0AAD6WY67_9AGAR|nr:hypothetical protein C8F04DRAFT_964879 [Mycena alexandri]
MYIFERYDVNEGLDDYDDDNRTSNPSKTTKKLPKAVQPGVSFHFPSSAFLVQLSDDAPFFQDKSLHDWVPKRDSFGSEFIRWYGPGDANLERCPGCSKKSKKAQDLQTPEFRCRDCHGGILYCRTCIVARHLENPLHRVYLWDGEFFKKTPLATLGLRIQLGHNPLERCTAPEPARKGFVTLHTNGIHEVELAFCGCERASSAGTPDIQLLRAGWFPATHERPHTAATFAVMDQYQQETCQAKVTMYDFYGVLEKLTGNTGIKPPDRYREFIRMCREYEHLLLLLFGGRSWAFDASGAEGTKSGELAIDCPACPRPDVNLVDGWMNAAPEERYVHLYTLFLGLDACFRLKRRLISSELRDPGLGTGWAYMVENGPYREYLRTVTDQKEMNTCSGLAALDYANTKFSRGYATTGVGMGVCARHEFVQPNGVGDLQRGERYAFANMDYIMGSILRHKDPRLWKLLSYDIVCSWSKNFKECMANLPALVRLAVVLTLFKFVIPKLHIHSHTVLCQLLFSLNLILGSAQTDGEGIERPWASIGGVATSTCDMGPGSRHGVLDFQWSYWNWEKLVGIVASLRRRLDNARAQRAEQQEIFDEFSREQADRVPAWKKRVHDFESDPTLANPYEVKFDGITEAQVRLQFAEQEAKDAQSGLPAVHDVSPSKFMTLGLDLEDEQRRIRVQAVLKKANTTGQQIDLKGMRTKLNRQLQGTYTPAALQMLGDMDIPEEQTIENMPLLLPSALSAAARATGCLGGLPHVEALMRDAQCRAALASLRNQLHVKSRLLVHKKKQVRHQGACTRARTIVTRNEGKIGLHSEKYQMLWEAIRLLGDGDPDKVGWQVLKKDDIRCMEDTEDLVKKAQRRENQAARQRRRNAELIAHGLLPAEMDVGMVEEPGERVPENRRQISWIWTVAGTTGSRWEADRRLVALRIEWSKVYARTRRWKEEVELLEAEYERVLISFAHEAQCWDARGAAVRVGIISRAEAEGAVAFAKRQAAMFRDLIERGKMTWTEDKLPRGKKRARQPTGGFSTSFLMSAAMPAHSILGAGAMEGEGGDEEEDDARGEEEEEEREREEDELLRAERDVDDDEYILSGAVDDD